jgi:hypothetical protein
MGYPILGGPVEKISTRRYEEKVGTLPTDLHEQGS